MASYSFKSVGKTQEKTELETLTTTKIPYGIKTPLQLGSSEGILAMNYSLEDQFADNLRNLLLTNWGERVCLYRFGANLKPLTTEFVSQESFDNEAILRIKSAVEEWMPFIELQDFSSSINRTDNKNTAIINIDVTYTIPLLQTSKRGIQIVLYAI